MLGLCPFTSEKKIGAFGKEVMSVSWTLLSSVGVHASPHCTLTRSNTYADMHFSQAGRGQSLSDVS
jgi:hypothetical protein